MNNIIDTLKSEHMEVQNVLRKLQSGNVTGKESLQLIFEFKEKLVAHIKKEDELLYPELERLAQENLELKLTLDMFRDEMVQISEELNNFLNHYPDVASIENRKSDFIKDISKMIVLIKNRIIKEEVIIFKQYQKILDKKEK